MAARAEDVWISSLGAVGSSRLMRSLTVALIIMAERRAKIADARLVLNAMLPNGTKVSAFTRRE